MLTLGLHGYGYWGPNLARNIAATPGCELIAVADASPERAELARRQHNLKPGARPSQADAVVIATPVATHHELAKAALERGQHVFVEKPLAASVAEAEELVAIAAARRLVLMVDHTFVYTGAVRKIRELLPELGELVYFDSVRVNLGRFRPDVNVLWDLAPHDVSILLHLVGQEPTRVAAIEGAPGVAYLSCWFPGGPFAHSHLNWRSPVKIRRIMLGGDRKLLVYDELEPSEKVRVYDRGADWDEQTRRVDYRTGDMIAPHLDRREALAVALEHFADCVRDGSRPLTGGPEGLAVVRVLEQASRQLP